MNATHDGNGKRERPASPTVSRRNFLQSSLAGAAVVSAPTIIPSSALGRDGAVAPSERIVMGGIGIGFRGSYVLSEFLKFPQVQFAAVADCQLSRREAAKQKIDKHYNSSDCEISPEMFDVLERQDIDGVLIATGDRWHTMLSLLAARAGKDIYCEKPCSLTFQESRALSEGVSIYGNIYQAGTQRRNIDNFVLATKMAKSGRLGKLRKVHANILAPGANKKWLPAEPEPDPNVCDWNRWLGPVPYRPFNEIYVSGWWDEHYDLEGGGILAWGAHTVDLCQIANAAETTAPLVYTPNEAGVECTYANGVKLVLRTEGWLGLGACAVRFEGDEGWVETGDSGTMRVEPESLSAEKRVFLQQGASAYTHVAEFLDCVKTRRPTSANETVAAQTHIVCHAAYIAWQLGRTIRFDPVKEEFDDEQANRLRSRAMRAPWSL